MTPIEPPLFESVAIAALCAWLMVQPGLHQGKLVWRPRRKRDPR